MTASEVIKIIYNQKKGSNIIRLKKAQLHYGFSEQEVLLAICMSEYTFIIKSVLIRALMTSIEIIDLVNNSKGSLYLVSEIKKYYENEKR